MSENTVRKYVMSLEEKRFITTEPTSIRTKDGRSQNGSLLYTIRPIQEAINRYNERQLRKLEEAAAKQRTVERLAEFGCVSPCVPLCASLEAAAP